MVDIFLKGIDERDGLVKLDSCSGAAVLFLHEGMLCFLRRAAK